MERVEEISLDVFTSAPDEVFRRRAPGVIRGLGRHWPAVRAGREGAGSFAEYLSRFDRGAAADVFVGEPEIDGKFFYSPDMQGFNFRRMRAPFGAALLKIIEEGERNSPKAMYVGALTIPDNFPGFEADNPASFMRPGAPPRLWVGGRVTVWTHYDLSENIAINLAGRRRFTLFPPDQIKNMYVGPLDATMAGQPVSLPSPINPDLAKFPRFSEALSHALVAEIEPGDAIFMPGLWWHHVESMEPFNALLNFWWDEFPSPGGSPFEAMVHAIAAIRDLPEDRRDLWRMMFDHYAFSGGADAAAHLPDHARGVLGPMTPANAARTREWLINSMRRRN